MNLPLVRFSYIVNMQRTIEALIDHKDSVVRAHYSRCIKYLCFRNPVFDPLQVQENAYLKRPCQPTFYHYIRPTIQHPRKCVLWSPRIYSSGSMYRTGLPN